MRSARFAVALVGLGLTACGAAEPAGGALPPPSPVTESSTASAPTPPSTEVPGTGDPYDPAARISPELMTITPSIAFPGAAIGLTFPEGTERGVAYVLERAFGDRWSTTHFLTSSTDGYGGSPSAWAVDSAEGHEWEAIGIAGPGPDRLLVPDDATLGASRICTANAIENFCAELTVVSDDAAPVTTPAPGSAASETAAPPETTTSPSTTTPVPIIAVHEGVAFYPACGNETLTFDGATWYQLNHYDGYDEEYAAIYEAFADAEREPSPIAGRRGFARVMAPGPGDDIGTLVIWADGVARWVSDSGDLDVWMVDDEITYNWEC